MIFCVLCNKQPFYNTNTCIIFGCKYSPKFNHEGETKLLYCKKHATDATGDPNLTLGRNTV